MQHRHQQTDTSGEEVAGTLTGFVGDYASAAGDCRAIRGADRVYVMTVPAGLKVSTTATPTPDGGFDVLVNLLPPSALACDGVARRCLAAADVGGEEVPETVAWTNVSAGDEDVFVVVGDSQNPSRATDFTLLATLDSPPVGESCLTPKPLAAGTHPGQTLAGFSREYTFATTSTSCASYRTNEVVYAVQVGAGQRLTLVGTPVVGDGGATGANDLVLNLLDGPECSSAATCLARANASSSSGPETLSWLNLGAGRTVFVLAAGSPSLTFDLTLTLQ